MSCNSRYRQRYLPPGAVASVIAGPRVPNPGPDSTCSHRFRAGVSCEGWPLGPPSFFPAFRSDRMKKMLLLFGIAAVAAVAMACGDQASTPAAPTPAVSSDTAAAAADGSTLKATAPAPQQPGNGSTAESLVPNLVIANSTLKYLGDVSLTSAIQYRIVVETQAGAQVV